MIRLYYKNHALTTARNEFHNTYLFGSSLSYCYVNSNTIIHTLLQTRYMAKIKLFRYCFSIASNTPFSFIVKQDLNSNNTLRWSTTHQKVKKLVAFRRIASLHCFYLHATDGLVVSSSVLRRRVIWHRSALRCSQKAWRNLFNTMFSRDLRCYWLSPKQSSGRRFLH